MELPPVDLHALGAAAATLAQDDLWRALDGYEDMPLELILDASADVAFEPLAPPPHESETTERSVDSCASACSSPDSAVLDGAPPVSAAATGVEMLRHMPRSRRLKEERAFLQSQVAELERALTRLAAQRRSLDASPWRDVAARQHTRRLRAEAQNARLRAKLLRQSQVAKSLEVVLRLRECRHDQPQDVSEPRASASPHSDEPWMDDLGAVLRRFVVEIQRAYEAVAAVLPAAPTTTPPIENRSIVRSHAVDGAEQLYVETRQRFVVPFSFKRVAAVAWDAFTRQFESQQRQLELYCRTADLFACKFASRPLADPHDLGDGRESVATATTLARCYTDHHGPQRVVVWRGFIAANDATLRDAVAVCTGWLAIRPLDGGDTDRAAVHVCIRTAPRRCDLRSLELQSLVRLPTNTPEVGAFVSQKLCTSAEDIMLVVEEIENLLLDQ